MKIKIDKKAERSLHKGDLIITKNDAYMVIGIEDGLTILSLQYNVVYLGISVKNINELKEIIETTWNETIVRIIPSNNLVLKEETEGAIQNEQTPKRSC